MNPPAKWRICTPEKSQFSNAWQIIASQQNLLRELK
jgi:hypothetical protein